ncbi:lytic transglycosylase domain-containing protein [Bacillus sp. N9]
MKKAIKKAKKATGSKKTSRLIFNTRNHFLFIAIYYDTNNEKQEVKRTLVPLEFVPIYEAAEREFGVPAYLLAAHHRVETIFSTMDPMLSPAGAEGPMQFMPCTFVGWSHPSCGGLGLGDIPEEDKVNPAIIQKYGGYGVDANGDGKADPWDIEDAIFSAANFLSKYGAAEGKLSEAVYAYNHSEKYVEDVLYFANLYKEELTVDVQNSK